MSYEPVPIDSVAEELVEFVGDFSGYIQRLKEQWEGRLGDDAGAFESVDERAEFEASNEAAQNWLTARWGNHYPCPVCRNVEWAVSIVLPAQRPLGFLSFHVTCGYCANTMQIVPGKAFLDHPIRNDPQLQFPSPDR